MSKAPRVIRFFPYYGAKQSRWRKYPPPTHGTIIEPFAGSAAYATHYADRDVILLDKDPRVIAMWDWLISVSREDFLRLPVGFDRVSDTGLPEGPERDFLRSWSGDACASWWSTDKVTPLMKAHQITNPGAKWTAQGRERLATQLDLIRHWAVVSGGYEDAPDVEATWFIDPPYITGGQHYREGVSSLVHVNLAAWCQSRKGQVIVCEGGGASWLPFTLLGGDGARRVSCNKGGGVGRGRAEMVWVRP